MKNNFEKPRMATYVAMLAYSICCTLTGAIILWLSVKNIWVVIGVAFMIWGSNIQVRSQKYKPKEPNEQK